METQREAELVQEIESLRSKLAACQAREAAWKQAWGGQPLGKRRAEDTADPTQSELGPELTIAETEQTHGAPFNVVADPIWSIDLQDASIEDDNDQTNDFTEQVRLNEQLRQEIAQRVHQERHHQEILQ